MLIPIWVTINNPLATDPFPFKTYYLNLQIFSHTCYHITNSQKCIQFLRNLLIFLMAYTARHRFFGIFSQQSHYMFPNVFFPRPPRLYNFRISRCSSKIFRPSRTRIAPPVNSAFALYFTPNRLPIQTPAAESENVVTPIRVTASGIS